MGKKLAVLFPGIGYSVDRPLLYYSKKVLKAKGYEIIEVNYGNLRRMHFLILRLRKYREIN
ncbi:MAG: hypothetical protein MJ113_03185 [Lachnospiraceae bacterium]|nr:hypothetical protein [Lachnospiraceae bacterium]